jgi:hypothetical protein
LRFLIDLKAEVLTMTPQMSRSIHSTKKQRLRELKYSYTDNVSASAGMTGLEREGLTKDVYKVNAGWKKQADKQDSPVQAHLKLKDSITRTVNYRKQKKV